MLTAREIDGLVTRIAAYLKPVRIMLFGSYAKGTATPASDVDLLVVYDTALPVDRRSALVAPFIVGYSVPIDIHIYTPDEVDSYGPVEHSFLNAVLRTGKTVYEN